MSDNDENYWWYGKKCSLDDMTDRAASMTPDELNAVLSEMGAVSAQISVRVQDKTLNSEERGRARYALAHVSEKRKILRSIVTSMVQLSEGREDRMNRVEDMLDHVDSIAASDPPRAIRTLTAALRAFWNIE